MLNFVFKYLHIVLLLQGREPYFHNVESLFHKYLEQLIWFRRFCFIFCVCDQYCSLLRRIYHKECWYTCLN